MKLLIATTVMLSMAVLLTSPVFAAEYEGYQLTQAPHKAKPGINSDKVCGGELCNGGNNNRNSINTSSQELTKVYTVSEKENTVKRALESLKSLAILNDYYEYKGISFNDGIVDAFDNVRDVDAQIIVEELPPETTEDVPEVMVEADPIPEINEYIDNGLYANPDFAKPQTIEELDTKHEKVDAKQLELERILANFPSYLKTSYENPDHPKYVPKPKVVEEPIVIESDIVEVVEEVEPEPEYGICGEGTILIDGVCSIPQMEPEPQMESELPSGLPETVMPEEIVAEPEMMP